VVGARRAEALAAVALALSVGALIMGGRTALAPSGDRVDPARLRALEARVAFLEAHLRRPMGATLQPQSAEQAAPAPELSAGETAAAPAAAKLPPPRFGAAAAVDEVALQRAYFGELDARLAAEVRDPAWAAPTEELLRGTSRELRPRISVEAAQCGRSMCRVETASDPQEEGPALDRFITATVSLLPEVVVRDGDLPGRRVVYFARKVGEFPAMVPEAEGPAP
jgi:hypothetical protein